MGGALPYGRVAGGEAVGIPDGAVADEPNVGGFFDGFGKYALGIFGRHTGSFGLGADAPLCRFLGVAAVGGECRARRNAVVPTLLRFRQQALLSGRLRLYESVGKGDFVPYGKFPYKQKKAKK